MINSIDDITNAFYINLEHRVDRRLCVENELNKLNISAERFNAIKMENGAIGCSLSHLKILQNAIKNNITHVLIVEDDIKFLDPILFKNQLNLFFEKQKDDWDVVLFAGNNVGGKVMDESYVQVEWCQTTTGYLVNGRYIKTLEQNIKSGLTNLLQNPTNKNEYAIDKYWIRLQRKDKWFLITPLTVVQCEGYSDIEKRNTDYKNLMLDLHKDHLKFLVAQGRSNNK
jgi:glycosyl transferase family 25